MHLAMPAAETLCKKQKCQVLFTDPTVYNNDMYPEFKTFHYTVVHYM